MNPGPDRPEETPPQAEYLLAPPAPAEAPVAAPTAPKRGFGRALGAAIVIAIIVATGGGIGIGWNLARMITSRSTESPVQTVDQGTTGSGGTLNNGTIASRVDPAIVDVNTIVQTTRGTAQAAGTGLILTSSGDVLTNNHVVEGSIRIQVTIAHRSGTYTAMVVGVDPSVDLAVIHVENVSGLPTVKLADSSKVSVGDPVVALGNALGLGGTPKVTQGTITALDQTITASENGSRSEQLNGMIQSDVQISPGDSGGALVNRAGQVVGIITAGEAQGFRSSTSNVAYAIPSSTAATIANRILDGQAGDGVLIGPVGYLGVGVDSLDAETAAQLGLSLTSGALVRSVQQGSPADGAGIVPGTVITKVNGTTIDSATDLGDALHAFKPGDRVSITWVDAQSSHSATVTLIAGPAV
jgi:S1-C subfamily serine protease